MHRNNGVNATPYELTSPYASVLKSTGSSEKFSIPSSASSWVFVSSNPSLICVLKVSIPSVSVLLPS